MDLILQEKTVDTALTARMQLTIFLSTRAVLSQGEPRDAAKISIPIEFYNGIVRFFCNSTALFYTSVTTQMLKLFNYCYRILR